MPTITVLPPDLNMTGYWSLKEPFASYVKHNYIIDLVTTKLRVISITSMKDLILSNLVDPFTTIYQPAGLTEIDYKEDLINNTPIISLNTPTNVGEVIIRVPLNYISALPNKVDVVYRDKVIVIDLGPLPENVDTSVWKNDINDFILGRIGIKPAIKEVQIGLPVFIDHPSNIVRERYRTNSTTVKETYLIRYNKLTNAYNQLINNYNNILSCFKSAKVVLTNLTHAGAIPYLIANNYITLPDIYTYLIGPPDRVTGTVLDTYLGGSKSATITELLGIINNLNMLSGISILPNITPIGSNIYIRKGSSFSISIVSSAVDGTPYYWTIYSTIGATSLFETTTGVVYLLGGKAVFNIYTDAKGPGVLDTNLRVYVKLNPSDVGYTSISATMGTIEYTSSADNYSALYGSNAPIGINYDNYTIDDSNRAFMSIFYK